MSIGKPLSGMGAVKVRLNPEFLFFEKGTIRTDSQQIPVAYVHDVDAMQSMTQKARHVGSIRVTVIRPGRHPEFVLLEDLPDFRDGVEHINRVSRAARYTDQQRANTQHINYHGQAPQYQQPAPQAPPPQQPSEVQGRSDDIFSQIERLGELRDKGFISPEDFDQKKAELLARL